MRNEKDAHYKKENAMKSYITQNQQNVNPNTNKMRVDNIKKNV